MTYHRLYIQVIAAVVALIYTVLLWRSGITPEVRWLRGYSIAVLIIILLWGAWDRWIWRVSFFQQMRLIPPDVSGTWQGELRSHWSDSDTKTRAPGKDVYLVIRQTFSVVSVTLFTDESSSGSYSLLAKATKENGLSYLYLNEPEMDASEGSHMHRGAAMFRLSNAPVAMLRGRYWTDRETKGELVFRERHPKFADDYEMAAALFE